MSWRKKKPYAMLGKIYNTRRFCMKLGIALGLFVFQMTLCSLEPSRDLEPPKKVLFAQDSQEDDDKEEELIVFEDGDFTEDEFLY